MPTFMPQYGKVCNNQRYVFYVVQQMSVLDLKRGSRNQRLEEGNQRLLFKVLTTNGCLPFLYWTELTRQLFLSVPPTVESPIRFCALLLPETNEREISADQKRKAVDISTLCTLTHVENWTYTFPLKCGS